MLEKYQEWLNQEVTDPAKRNSLFWKLPLAAGAVLASGLVLPQLIRAEGWIDASKKPWSSRYWFPLGENAARIRGIPRLHDFGGPLHAYDRLYQAKYGINPRFREKAESYAERTRNYYPDTLDWAGGCDGLAHANIHKSQPSTKVESVAGVEIDYPNKVGLLVALHKIDDLYRPGNPEALIADFLATGDSFVAVVTEKGGTETWNMAAVAVSPDGQNVLVTSFGEDPKSLHISRIIDAYRPYPTNQRNLYNLDPTLLEPFSAHEIEIGGGFKLDNDLVEAVIYKGTLI